MTETTLNAVPITNPEFPEPPEQVASRYQLEHFFLTNRLIVAISFPDTMRELAATECEALQKAAESAVRAKALELGIIDGASVSK